MATYVPAIEVVWLAKTETVWLAGVVQPFTAPKVTVCDPTDNPVTTAPLFCKLPPSTAHCAPATLSVASSEPVCGIATYDAVTEVV